GAAVVTKDELEAALRAPGRVAAGGAVASAVTPMDRALAQRDKWRAEGLVVGFTNGCFDLVHSGHVSLISQSAAACDRLIVALNSDDSVRRLKGPTRPVQPIEARAAVMSGLKGVDMVMSFEEDTPLELIRALAPDVLVKGADYKENEVVGADLVKAWGGRIVLANLTPGQSTTALVAKAKI
ncbi:MAG: D-glycero-beta-D-manno-heptose 1-phosphate adenylyltransferase, partial [Caulobacterales bacterium]